MKIIVCCIKVVVLSSCVLNLVGSSLVDDSFVFTIISCRQTLDQSFSARYLSENKTVIYRFVNSFQFGIMSESVSQSSK